MRQHGPIAWGLVAERCRADKNSIRLNRSAEEYVKTHQVAWNQFSACGHNVKPSVSHKVEKRLVYGVKLGHRSLEHLYEHYQDERKIQAIWNVLSILFAYHGQGKRDQQLLQHSKRCSLVHHRLHQPVNASQQACSLFEEHCVQG